MSKFLADYFLSPTQEAAARYRKLARQADDAAEGVQSPGFRDAYRVRAHMLRRLADQIETTARAADSLLTGDRDGADLEKTPGPAS